MTIFEEETGSKHNQEIAFGYVYVMTHSFFSDVIRVGCTWDVPKEYAKSLSSKTIGDYHVVFSLQCQNPCDVSAQIKTYLNAVEYTKGFYQVSTEIAEKLFKREVLKIPELVVI